MEKLFVLKPTHTLLDIKDAINDRIEKVKAIITCLMFATEFLCEDVKLDKKTIFHALWLVDDSIEEINLLFHSIDKTKLS